MISWIFTPPWKRKPLGRIMYPIWIVNGGKLYIKRNMMRNIKSKHPCPENYERYRILRNQCVNIRKMWKKQYFTERCEGGPKNQHFPTIKPFISSRHGTNIDIMLRENDSTISESETVAKIFNKYFNEIAEGIGFNVPIPENFNKDETTPSRLYQSS